GEMVKEGETKEVGFMAARLTHPWDGDEGGGGAGAEACRRQTSGEAPPIGKPLERITDAGAVDGARAGAADCRREIEDRQAGGDRIERPGDTDENPAEQDDDLWPEAVDQPAFKRHQPG